MMRNPANRALGVLLRAAVLLLAFATTHFNAALRSHPCARGTFSVRMP